MGLLIYAINMSLDGYVADESGDFSWAAPNEEVHAFWNDFMRPIGTHLYGRRLYETMAVWETMDEPEGSIAHDFATVWRSAQKVVYSTSLKAAHTSRTRIERSFHAGQIATLKRESSRDISIGGPHLAATAFKLGLIDECSFVICPVIVGSGNRALPSGISSKLELLDERRFSNGSIYTRYKIAS